MGRIDAIFERLRSEGRSALMPFVTGGHPSLAATREVLPALQSAGASVVEIGIPFSDPIADGPVIAGAMHEALARGVTPRKVLDVVARVRAGLELGLVAMVSHSIVSRIGAARFVDDLRAAGMDGLIVPDVDVADAAALSDLARASDLSFSMLIAPTTPEARLGELCGLSSGFVYLLARAGITGEQEAAPAIAGRVAALRRHTELPIAVGFGISSPAHVAAVTASADAAIVGSALVRRMSEAADPVGAAGVFVADLARGLRVA